MNNVASIQPPLQQQPRSPPFSPTVSPPLSPRQPAPPSSIVNNHHPVPPAAGAGVIVNAAVTAGTVPVQSPASKASANPPAAGGVANSSFTHFQNQQAPAPAPPPPEWTSFENGETQGKTDTIHICHWMLSE